MVSNAHVDANSFIVQCAEQCSAVLTVYVSLCCPFVGLAVSCKRLQSFLLASFSPADAFVWQLKVFPANLCHYKKYKETRVLFIMCWLALSSSSSSSFAAATAQFRILNHKIIHFVFLHCIAISSHVWKTFIPLQSACVRYETSQKEKSPSNFHIMRNRWAGLLVFFGFDASNATEYWIYFAPSRVNNGTQFCSCVLFAQSIP